ncbi:hypothetical protein MPSEU_000067500 [Mayamaea pseudoterrestris]|nr:hypothetical protein MPSEU_000067500 [Mayamaea pseudoterrestris]
MYSLPVNSLVMCRSEKANADHDAAHDDWPAMNRHAISKRHIQIPATTNTTLSQYPSKLVRKTCSWSETSMYVLLGSIFGFAMVAFSVYFPFILAPMAASQTYYTAFFVYQDEHHFFDNTIWTYGTDYLLASCMALLIYKISTNHSASRTLAWRSRGLLLCYMVSVMAGGVAHQCYTTLEQRNSFSFRLLWTICVGTVTAASAFMGPIGSELMQHCAQNVVPWIPTSFWWAYGTSATLICVYGGLSFQRPACDIFIAGITQFPSTFYVMSILWAGLPTSSICKSTRIIGICGFILNAPLLPMYPLLVQYTDWSLASINTLLHMWLLSAWSLQGLTLARIERALAADATPPPQAVPMKVKKVL